MIQEFTRVGEVKVTYSQKIKATDRPKITQSKTAADIFRQFYPDDLINYKEQFSVMFLNRQGRVLGVNIVSVGSGSACIVDAKIVFQSALLTNAESIILCHNHPSGETKPSEADKQLTKQLKEGGKLLGINILDHLILSSEHGYLSMADEGLI